MINIRTDTAISDPKSHIGADSTVPPPINEFKSMYDEKEDVQFEQNRIYDSDSSNQSNDSDSSDSSDRYRSYLQSNNYITHINNLTNDFNEYLSTMHYVDDTIRRNRMDVAMHCSMAHINIMVNSLNTLINQSNSNNAEMNDHMSEEYESDYSSDGNDVGYFNQYNTDLIDEIKANSYRNNVNFRNGNSHNSDSSDYDSSNSSDSEDYRLNDEIDDFEDNSSFGKPLRKGEPIINNLTYKVQNIGFGKQYISGASGFPPRLSDKEDAVCRMIRSEDDIETEWEDVEYDYDHGFINNIIGNTKVEVEYKKDKTVKLYNIVGTDFTIEDDIIHGNNSINTFIINEDNIITIPRHNVQWKIKIPIYEEDTGNIEIIEMLADTGANVGCIDEDYAKLHWPDCIFKVTRKDVFRTPGGNVSPTHCVHFLIPTKSGKFLRAILYLVRNLPTNIIADMNMLLQLGYKFEQPKSVETYIHKETEDVELYINHEKIHKVVIHEDEQGVDYEIDKYKHNKLNMIEYRTDIRGNDERHLKKRKLSMCEEIYSNNECLYDNQHGSLINSDSNNTKLTTNERINFIHNELIDNETLKLDNIMSDKNVINAITTSKYYIPDMQSFIQADPTSHEINANSNHDLEMSVIMVNNENKQMTNSRLLENFNNRKHRNHSFGTRDVACTQRIGNLNYANKPLRYNKLATLQNRRKYINFIIMKESFKATEREIKEAEALNADKKLTPNDPIYLKDYPKIYGRRMNGIYEAITGLMRQYKDVFAVSTYHRRTMRVEPVRLGIMDKFRTTTCYKSQYPLSAMQRRWMIYYTQINERNKYWFPISSANHCIPFTMVSKKNAKGVVTRMRPALDCRLPNTMCENFIVNMPTLRDFDELYAIKGFFTLADMKNMYDCIPLHKLDQPWATVMTPLGLYQMRCLGYGWKNAPAIAQNIMNRLALSVGWTLVYIDDICIKHKIEWGTKEITEHIKKLFEYCRKHNMLLSPTKFFPCVDKCKSFGFERTLDGSTISEDYKQKIITFSKPTNTTELKEFLGMVGYITRYLYHGSLITYWMNELLQRLPEKGKIKWDAFPEADIAYQQILWLTENAPLLYNPTNDGTFLIKCDACNYGIGAVLYQRQKDKHGNWKWRIIDMMSKQMPQGLRHAHSMVHEAWAIVQACQQWQFHLLKREFIISTDNQPISKLFTQKYRDLNDQTQRQLLRLRIAITMYNYEMRHVPGVDNELPDGLSRFTMKLIKAYPRRYSAAGKILDYSMTKHKPLTQEQKDELLKYSNLLTKQYQALKSHIDKDIGEDDEMTNEEMINFIQGTEELKLNQINELYKILEDHQRINLPINNQFDIIMKHYNAVWNDTLYNYSKASSYSERNAINTVLNSATQENVYLSDEYAFNTMPISQFINHCGEMGRTLSKMSMPMINYITKETQRVTDEIMAVDMFNEIKLHPNHIMPLQNDNNNDNNDEFDENISDIDDEHINDSDEEYKPTQKVKTKHKSIIKTRRQKKKQKKEDNKRLKALLDNDPLLDKMYDDVEFVEPDYESVTKKMAYRDEFMTRLYGYRNNINVFNHSVFRSYQYSDTAIKLVRFLVWRVSQDRYDPDNDQKCIKAIKLLQEENLDYWNLFISHKFSINKDGILVVDTTDELVKQPITAYVVPIKLRGKLMDYAHHNINSHHYAWKQTYWNLCGFYYWPNMRSDIKKFVKRCLLCHYVKGEARHRSPMQIRDISQPREHIMIDFIGHIFGKYYILAIIDYCTGWTMLIPCKSSDKKTVVYHLLQRWIPLHGQFKYLDSDYGSYFNSSLWRALMEAQQVNQQYTEPRSHRGIGKVERIIRLVQTVLQRFNIQLGESLTNKNIQESDKSWEIIKLILPHIQTAINQRRPRFTTFSPNMLMFGTNMRDLSNIDVIYQRLWDVFNRKQKAKLITHDNNEDNQDSDDNSTQEEEEPQKLKYEDFQYLEKLLQTIKTVYGQFKDDWMNYTWLSKMAYDKDKNITPTSIEAVKQMFKKGTRVLYYIGDQQHANKKWRTRWTGPWIIKHVLNDSTVIIADIDTGNQKRVSKDRIKQFKPSQYITIKKLMRSRRYDRYQTQLKQLLYNLGTKVKTELTSFELDFRKVRKLDKRIDRDNNN